MQVIYYLRANELTASVHSVILSLQTIWQTKPSDLHKTNSPETSPLLNLRNLVTITTMIVITNVCTDRTRPGHQTDQCIYVNELTNA